MLTRARHGNLTVTTSTIAEVTGAEVTGAEVLYLYGRIACKAKLHRAVLCTGRFSVPPDKTMHMPWPWVPSPMVVVLILI